MSDKALNSVVMIDPERLKMEGEARMQTFRVDTAAFIFVIRGRGRVTINLRTHELVKDDFITIIQGSMVQLHEWSDDFLAYLLNFSTGFTRDLDLWKNTIGSMRTVLENPVMHLSRPENIMFMNSYCSMLYEIYSTQDVTYKQEIIKNMLEAVMFTVSGFYQDHYRSADERPAVADTKISRRHDIYKRFIDLVTKSYDQHREVAYYADILCITPKHLGYVVKSTSGMLASDTIARAVIMDAKSKLKGSDMSVGEISDSLNFPNHSFFCKYFRKHTGLSPRQFRESGGQE